LRQVFATVALAAIVIATALPGGPTPAQAAVIRTVWVDVRVNSAWPVARAVSVVDAYTGTRMRFGRCRAEARCLVIREDAGLPGQWAAVTNLGYPITRIRLNPHRRVRPYAERQHTLVHELGHAMGVYTHNPRCVSVMYYNMRCPNGRLAPAGFTAAERRALHRN
jgi:hypothetical protein